MKNFTKIAFAALALSASAASASAQLTSAATVTVSATVSASLAASNGGNLSFGSVIQGGSATTILASASGAGKVNIVGANNSGITITATTLPASLANGANNLAITGYQYCYSQSNSNASCTGTSIASGGTITGQSLSTTGNGYLWIGATLAAPAAAQAVGNYSATMTITVTTP